mgnify:CR=1 FL=1
MIKNKQIGIYMDRHPFAIKFIVPKRFSVILPFHSTIIVKNKVAKVKFEGDEIKLPKWFVKEKKLNDGVYNVTASGLIKYE